MKRVYFVLIVISAIGTAAFSQVQQDANQSNGQSGPYTSAPAISKPAAVTTFFSTDLTVGEGIGHAWVSENTSGEPVEVGITLSEKALENLPAQETDYVFELPKDKGKNFYTFAMLNWNPNGHNPVQIYGVPHFDFHFYIVPNEKRLAIGADDMKQFANAPGAKYIPEKYMLVPGGVMAMGAHWADVTSPEFNGNKFTRTFLWGSYDGSFIFWEPMVTREYLLSHPNDLLPVRQPASYQRDGYYPMNYQVSWSETDKSFTVSIRDLVFHKGE